MENSKQINLTVNGNKIYLSSETKVFKTERFFFATKKIAEIDKFVMEIAEEIQTIAKSLVERLEKNNSNNTSLQKVFEVQTLDKQFSFLFVVGKQLKLVKRNYKESIDFEKLDDDELEDLDIIFFDDQSKHENLRLNDQCVVDFLKKSKVFSVIVKEIEYEVSISDFKKLYHVSGSNYVNMPLLSGKQKELVELENKNVLVQGVAGSGKTNICISKIIFVSCRNYSGKVLYTTFSRGLLIDTKNKIELFKNSIKDFISSYEHNQIVFLDNFHKKAIENRLGLSLGEDSDTNIISKLKQVLDFLETHVDYHLIEDICKEKDYQGIATEKTFEEKFLKSLNNHQLKSKLASLKNLSVQIIYKEIYGMVFGTLTENEKQKNTDGEQTNLRSANLANGEMLSLSDYTKKRENSFSKAECEVIYGLAKEYDKFKKSQKLADNNDISRKLLSNIKNIQKYSLCILDEVQDFTQINLMLFEKISLKILAVGDALQMINPSYFNFSFLKNLMYREDVTDVAELEYNFRNNQKIAKLLNKLGEINLKEFGTHSFVTNTKSVNQTAISNIVFTDSEKFLEKLKNEKFENFTILASDNKSKEELKKLFKRQEVLTISEIKGLERDTVLMINILSDNSNKWQMLERLKINHKQSDENSVYRYYFNLFYVGLSRAKHNIFVFENQKINIFENFFKQNFECLDGTSAYEKFTEIISKVEIDDDEILERVEEFIKLGQFDNARFYTEKLEDAILASQISTKIDVFEEFVFKGKNREAGIKLWKSGMTNEAKKQFEISGDTSLIELLENLESKNMQNLDIEVVKFFTEFDDNKQARELIVDVVKQDLKLMQQKHQEIKNKLKDFKEKKHG